MPGQPLRPWCGIPPRAGVKTGELSCSSGARTERRPGGLRGSGTDRGERRAAPLPARRGTNCQRRFQRSAELSSAAFKEPGKAQHQLSGHWDSTKKGRTQHRDDLTPELRALLSLKHREMIPQAWVFLLNRDKSPCRTDRAEWCHGTAARRCETKRSQSRLRERSRRLHLLHTKGEKKSSNKRNKASAEGRQR